MTTASPPSARGRAALGLALLGATACHQVEVLPLPDGPDVRAALLFVVDGDEVQAAYAADLDGPMLRIEERGALFGLFYTCPLERVGLSPGRVGLDSVTQNAVRVPAPAFAGRLADGEGWRAAPPPAAVEDATRRLPLAADAACVHQGTRLEGLRATVPIDQRAVPAFVTPLYDGTALAASANGFYYRIRASGAVEPLAPLVDADPLGAYTAPDGALWLLDAEGTLWSGSIDGGLQVVAEAPGRFAPRDAVALAGPDRADAPFELFVTRRHYPRWPDTRHQVRELMRFAGGAWSTVQTASVADGSAFFVPRVHWRGPDAAVTYGMDEQDAVSVYAQGRVEVLPTPAQVDVFGLGLDDDGQIMIGASDGAAYAWAGDAWTRLRAPAFSAFLTELHPLPGGDYLFGGLTSLAGFRYGFGTWHPDQGACEPVTLSNVVARMAPIDDETFALLTITSLTSRQAFGIELLRVDRPRARCSGE